MNKILLKLIEGKGRFFLGRNWPEEPIVPPQHVTLPEFYNQNTLHLGGDVFGYEKKLKDYKKAVQVCIDEALKNGEVVNPQVLPVSFYHNSVLGLGRLSHNETHEPIDDGQTFDLPDGCGFEEVLIDPADFGKPPAIGVRLLPEKPVQEESQEDLLQEIDDRLTVGEDDSDRVQTGYCSGVRDTLEMIKLGFTIKRKDS